MPNSNANFNSNQIENLDIITMISQLETPINTENFTKTVETCGFISNSYANKENYKNAIENIKPYSNLFSSFFIYFL